MNYQNILVEKDGRILVVTINRPDVMNALNPDTHTEMARAFDEFEADQDLWVAIVTGSGDSAFCAGGDISVMRNARTEADYQVPTSGYGGLTNRFTCNKPIIAAVNGIALGGGFEIAMSCDIVVAADTAMFGLPEPRIGVAAVASGMHRLVRDIGLKPAMELLLTGEFVNANRALELGLVNKVTPPAEVLEHARDYAQRILKCAPLAIQATKQSVLQGRRYASVEQAMRAQSDGEFPQLQNMLLSEDTSEGLNAFMEKRAPVWRGR